MGAAELLSPWQKHSRKSPGCGHCADTTRRAKDAPDGGGEGRPEHTGRDDEVEVLGETCQGHTRVKAYWEHLR